MPLRLVSGNSKPRSKTATLDSVTRRMLRIDCSGYSPLMTKVARLESQSARAAAAVEKLVEGFLEDLDR